MSKNLDALINDITMLGLEKEASAAIQPEDNLVKVLQSISTSLTKKAEAGEMPETPATEGAEVAGAIMDNAEDVAAAVASGVSAAVAKSEKKEEGMDNSLVQKISQAVACAVKEAVEGNAAFGLAGDASKGSPSGAGNVQNMAEQILQAKTEKKTVTDNEMVAPGGATDPMVGVTPTPQGGEQESLQAATEIKAAMAKMSNEDVVMMFKLASIGYDVSVETLSEEIVQEKIAQAQYTQKVAQQQRAYAEKVAYNRAYQEAYYRALQAQRQPRRY